VRRAAALGAGLAALLAGSAQAVAPRVQTMVVGPRAVLFDAHFVTAGATRVRVGGRSCRVRGGSGLATLASARRRGGPRFGVTGDCGAPYVRAVGRFAARGPDGWYYKVGQRAPTIGSGAVLRSIRPGVRVLWFWCRFRAASCQRTLAVQPAASRVKPGASLTVTVTGYDDRGRGRRIAGAAVRLGAARARTDAHGRAVLHAPAHPGTAVLRAERAGLVPAFPERVTVG